MEQKNIDRIYFLACIVCLQLLGDKEVFSKLPQNESILVAKCLLETLAIFVFLRIDSSKLANDLAVLSIFTLLPRCLMLFWFEFNGDYYRHVYNTPLQPIAENALYAMALFRVFLFTPEPFGTAFADWDFSEFKHPAITRVAAFLIAFVLAVEFVMISTRLDFPWQKVVPATGFLSLLLLKIRETKIALAIQNQRLTRQEKLVEKYEVMLEKIGEKLKKEKTQTRQNVELGTGTSNVISINRKTQDEENE